MKMTVAKKYEFSHDDICNAIKAYLREQEDEYGDVTVNLTAQAFTSGMGTAEHDEIRITASAHVKDENQD